MVKYVKCIQVDVGVPLTHGNSYKIVNSDKVSYLIQDDGGDLEWWNKYRFEEPYELPESITFASQEEFENAVMEVVMKRLEVSEKRQGDYYTDEVVFDLWDKQ